MKLDEDYKIFIKVAVIISLMIMLLIIISFLISIFIKKSDAYTRSQLDLDIKLWASHGCYISDVKYNNPIYKCEVRDDN